jgi:integrase/recombinase XerD
MWPGPRAPGTDRPVVTDTRTDPHRATSVDSVVRSYLDHLAVERGAATNTLSSYRRDLVRYRAFLTAAGVTDLGHVTAAMVGQFLARLREGGADHPPLSATSAGRAVVTVRGLHRFALREGVVARDVAHEIKPPVPPRRLPKAISVDDVSRLLDAAGYLDTPLALRDRALLEILYGTGARISEATGLGVGDVDLDARIVSITGKGGKQRRVPLGSYAAAATDAYLIRARPVLAASGDASPRMFLNSRGGPLSRQSAWAVLRAAAERAGLPDDLSPHTLRHSYATHLMEGGADVRVVQELLGHASVTTTQIYTLVTVDALREVYAAAHPRAL